jgi:Ca-activated chloride channel family protein
MKQFSFEYPWVLLFILLFLICAKLCKIKNRSIYFPHLDALFASNVHRDRLLSLLKWLSIIMALVALASPLLTKEYSNSKKNGRDIVLVIDTSGSMQQGRFDMKNLSKNKFDVVKEVASDFVLRRKDDRIGLITFADVAFVSSPLTFEKKFLAKIINMQRLGIAGQKTAINDALVQAYAMLERSASKSKIVILLTDGVDNMSKVSVDEVSNLISMSDIKLYTIGIGSTRDYDGRSLKAFAKVGGGEAFSATNSKMLHEIYSKIDTLEVTKIDDKKIIQQNYLFFYPLFIAILSLMLFIYFRVMGGGR